MQHNACVRTHNWKRKLGVRTWCRRGCKYYPIYYIIYYKAVENIFSACETMWPSVTANLFWAGAAHPHTTATSRKSFSAVPAPDGREALCPGGGARTHSTLAHSLSLTLTLCSFVKIEKKKIKENAWYCLLGRVGSCFLNSVSKDNINQGRTTWYVPYTHNTSPYEANAKRMQNKQRINQTNNQNPMWRDELSTISVYHQLSVLWDIQAQRDSMNS